MTKEREVWIKLRDQTPEGERIIQDSRSQRGQHIESPDHDRQTSQPVDRNVLKPLYVIFGLLVGWIALVVVLGALLPAAKGKPDVFRGVIYLAYMAVAAILFARSLKRRHSGKND